MDAMQIGLIILTALFTLVGIGSIVFVKKSGKRYIVAGKSLPLILVGTMLMAQATDANSTLGNAAEAYIGGLWLGFVFPLGLAMCLVVSGIWYAKPLNRMNLITLPDFYYRRFDLSHKFQYNPVELLTSIIMIISFIILVAGNIAGAGWILSWVFPIGLVEAMLIMGLIVFVYTVTGGIFASATTNVIQLYPAVIAFVASAIWLLVNYGWGTFQETVPAHFIDMSSVIFLEHGALIFWSSLLALGLGDVVALDFMERIFTAESPDTAQKGCFFGAIFTIIIGICASFIGLYGLYFFPGAEHANDILPAMATDIMPFAAGLFVLAGVVGAGASTASGGLLAVSAVFARNIFQRNVLHHKRVEMSGSEKEKFDGWLLSFTRLMGVPVMLAAVILAYFRPEPGILLVLAFDVVFAGCWIPLTMGLFWRKTNFAGALAAVIAGTTLRFILYFTIPTHLQGLDTLIPPVVSLIVLIIVSLWTQEQYPPNHDIIYDVPDDELVLSGER